MSQFPSAASPQQPRLDSYDIVSFQSSARDQPGRGGSFRPAQEGEPAGGPRYPQDVGIKYPPSMLSHDYRQAPRTAPLPAERGGSVGSHPVETVQVSDIINKLSFAAEENQRLRDNLTKNNDILDQKLQEISGTMDSQEKEKQSLKQDVSEATNKFFEARVAVLGFKCRTMQLQGQLETLRKELENERARKGGTAAGVSMTSMDELERLRKENHDLLQQIRSSQSPQTTALKHLRSQLDRIKREKEQSEIENLNLGAVIKELSEDLESLKDKRSLAQEEVERTTERYRLLEVQFREAQQMSLELRNQLSMHQSLPSHVQSHSKSLALLTSDLEIVQAENINLKAELQEAQSEIASLKAGLTDKTQDSQKLESENSTLNQKIVTLQQSMDLMQQKLERAGAPVPKPRTNVQAPPSALLEKVQGEKDKLEEEKQRLSEEIEQLRNQLDTSRRSRASAEKRLQDADAKCQELAWKVSHLQRESEQAEALAAPTQELEKLKRDLQVKEDMVEQLNRDKKSLREQCDHLEKEKRDAESRFNALETAATTDRERPVKAGKPVEFRLNEALGKAKSLEEDNDELRKRMRSLEEERDGKFQELQAVNAELQNALEERLRYVHEVDKYRMEMTQQKDEHCREAAQLRDEIAAANANYESLEDNLRSCRSDLKHEIEQRKEEVATLKRELEKKVVELQHVRSEQDGQKLQLRREVEQAQQDIKGYESECESLLKDYQSCAEKLTSVKEERDRMKSQVDMGLRELTKRADRIKMLEQHRESTMDRLQHMDMQLKMYNEDFDRERKAREQAIEVKQAVESQNVQLHKEIKDLQERYSVLVRQALQSDDTTNPEDSFPEVGRHSPHITEHKQQSREMPRPGQPSREHQQPPQFAPDQHSPLRAPSGSGFDMTQPPMRAAAFNQPDMVPGGTPLRAQPPDMGQPGGRPSVDQGLPVHRSQEQAFYEQPQERWSHKEPLEMHTGPQPTSQPYARPGVLPDTHGQFVHGMQSKNMEEQYPLGTGAEAAARQRLTETHPGMPAARQIPTGLGGLPGAVGTPGATGMPGPTGVPPARPAASGMGMGGGGGVAMGGGGGGGGMGGGGGGGGIGGGGGGGGGGVQPTVHIYPGGVPQGGLLPQATAAGTRWVAPGEVINDTPPTECCPICGKGDFKTQTDLEVHCAQCS